MLGERRADGLPAGFPAVIVPKSVDALRSLGVAAKKKMGFRLAAITGSAGKTTTKDFTAAMLARRFAVEKTPGNQNSQIGFPMSVVNLPRAPEWMVGEMGLSEPGDLSTLSRAFEPDVAAILLVAAAHLQYFASLDAIADGKAEILEGLKPGGTFVANADDPRVAAIAARHRGRVVRFGRSGDADVTAKDVVAEPDGSRFRLATPEGEAAVHLPVAGPHQVGNFLAAAAIAFAVGVPAADCAAASAGLRPAAHRGELLRHASGALFFDDAYNANPSSMRAALATLAALPARRRIAVLGDMLELGAEEERWHRETGALAAAAADLLVCVGPRARVLGEGAVAAGMSSSAVRDASSAEEAAGLLAGELAAGDAVLFKASRGDRPRPRGGRADGGGLTPCCTGCSTRWRAAIRCLNVFRYITFRTAMSAVTALAVALVLGPAMIRYLRRAQIGQSIRAEGPKTHLTKAGTPTMGGLLILLAVVSATLLWMDLSNRFVWIALATLVGVGAVGFADDWTKVTRRRSLGLTGRGKLVPQFLVAIAVAWAIEQWAGHGAFSTVITFPFLKKLLIDLGVLYIPFVALVVVGSSNAVNLTDGLDGLAIGRGRHRGGHVRDAGVRDGQRRRRALPADPVHPAVGRALRLLRRARGRRAWGSSGSTAIPADVFMGDVGSLPLGAAIAAVAVMTKQEILLAIVGGLFVLEALSVIIQVASFKSTGKRVFKMAPLHHHFELMGWAESRVIIRFWILALFFAVLGLSTLKLR